MERELPIRLTLDKNRRITNSDIAERLPGSEMPITLSQSFLSKAQLLGDQECMRMLNLSALTGELVP